MKNILFFLFLPLVSFGQVVDTINICHVLVIDKHSETPVKDIDVSNRFGGVEFYFDSVNLTYSNSGAIFIEDSFLESINLGIRSIIDMGNEIIIKYNDDGMVNIFYDKNIRLITYRKLNENLIYKYYSCYH